MLALFLDGKYIELRVDAFPFDIAPKYPMRDRAEKLIAASPRHIFNVQLGTLLEIV